MGEVATIEHDETPTASELPTVHSSAVTPMGLLNKAIDQGASIEQMKQLLDLQERWEANQARKEFDAAIAAAKAEIKPVTKNKAGHNSKYVSFDAYAREVDPVLAKFDLSYRFETEQEDSIRVTCVLTHAGGHSVRNTLVGPPDTSGSKNSIQAIGSTLTYLQRYTLIQALGLAAADDDDGQSANQGQPITEEQLHQLQTLLDDTGSDIAAFCKYMQVESLADLPGSKFDDAKSALDAKKKRGATQ